MKILKMLLFASVVLGAVSAQGQGRRVNSFERPDDLRLLKTNNTQISTVGSHATDGTRALKIVFQPADWPNVTFRPDTPWNWTGSDALTMDVTNPGTEAITFYVRVDDDPSADGVHHCRTGTGILAAGESRRFLMPFAMDPAALGMRGLPPVSGFEPMPTQGDPSFNLGHIVAMQIFLKSPQETKTLFVDNLRVLQSGLKVDSIVDQFGQYTRGEWPGKVKSVSNLVIERQQEENALKAHPTLPDRDRFGGWAKGPHLNATGWFRTEKAGGKWWLVDPEGHLFFSMGMNTVDSAAPTITTGREYLFSTLSGEDGVLARHKEFTRNIHAGPVKEGTQLDFYAANLERKYGSDYKKRWLQTTIDRLRSWGFNTVGNWSDVAFYSQHQIPFVAAGAIGGDYARVSTGLDYWGKMHDPFDPRFAQAAEIRLKPLAAMVKDNPYCVGYFIDNEMSWTGPGHLERYGLAVGALSASATSSAKSAFLKQLEAKYTSIGRLNAAWGTSFADWDAMRAPYKVSGTLNAAQQDDMKVFIKAFALRYFQTVRDTLKRLDPNHLYMGCRFAFRTPEAVAAAAEVCDVLSFNYYGPRIDRQNWGFLTTLNKPCIITEFHFGALDRGMFSPGLAAAPNQQARAKMFETFVRSVADNPALVGCHWFQYVDQPLTGRSFDGENYNIGFVTMTDTPYAEMVTAAKDVLKDIYARRSGSTTARAK